MFMYICNCSIILRLLMYELKCNEWMNVFPHSSCYYVMDWNITGQYPLLISQIRCVCISSVSYVDGE
ncbi:hypothetical protein DERF_013449 [Dermatophagoides farinae]|uniref:Uncharacterized protein n=1 Tax=Dermatophagoides farinae TaxID=6954 RepID=A0A922HQ71_DERFA|nr:hypothetical protein DERF_013449 [Dermatophagoides farinae]